MQRFLNLLSRSGYNYQLLNDGLRIGYCGFQVAKYPYARIHAVSDIRPYVWVQHSLARAEQRRDGFMLDILAGRTVSIAPPEPRAFRAELLRRIAATKKD